VCRQSQRPVQFGAYFPVIFPCFRVRGIALRLLTFDALPGFTGAQFINKGLVVSGRNFSLLPPEPGGHCFCFIVGNSQGAIILSLNLIVHSLTSWPLFLLPPPSFRYVPFMPRLKTGFSALGRKDCGYIFGRVPSLTVTEFRVTSCTVSA